MVDLPQRSSVFSAIFDVFLNYTPAKKKRLCLNFENFFVL